MDVSVSDLSFRFDIRQVVLRTILTYLELLGVLRQGTPFYASYEVRPLLELDAILKRFDTERRRFVESIFNAAKPAAIARSAKSAVLNHYRLHLQQHPSSHSSIRAP